QFVKGSGFLVYGTKTDAYGRGGCSSIHRDDPFEESTVHLSLEYRMGGYVFRFDKPSLFFTFPEPRYVVRIRTGQKIENLVRELEEKRLTTRAAFLKLAMEEKFAEFPFVPPPRANLNRFEGLFLPGVHSFAWAEISDLERIDVREELLAKERIAGSNIKKIVDQLLRESEVRFRRLPPSNGLKGYEQIILASIVEKEAAANRDYGYVASVFYNRLRWGSQLASCPAVEYALGYHRPFLTREDIRIDSPYNLYVREGLPPTPICFFSNDALEAVKNPQKSKFFYFVFDWIDGKLLFAESFEEHMKNAEDARSNYIKLYGKDSLYRKHYDKFYEN
ncbi:MAG TPA: endolytic transglycosylase MltG, partial [Spirochaetia bacterium]|nr:endolytic transglycosylase MltG [Spirochaetia bacterium]